MKSLLEIFLQKLLPALFSILLLLPTDGLAQIKMTLNWIEDIQQWGVFIKSEDSLNTTLTLYDFNVSVAASLDFEVGTITKEYVGIQLASETRSPIEQPNRVYYHFHNLAPYPVTVNFDNPLFLFAFGSKTDNCPDTLYLVKDDDPFIAPNSKSLNIGNSLDIFEYYPVDGFSGTYDESKWKCTNSSEIKIIAGKVFLDINHNRIFDEEEKLLRNQSITLLPDELTVFSNKVSGYRFFVERDSYQLQINTPPQWTLTTENPIVEISTLDSSATVDFGLFPLNGLNQYKIITPGSSLRCNTNTYLNFSILNDGYISGNGLIEIKLNPEITPLNFIPSPDFIFENIYFWYFNDLHTTYDFPIKVEVKTPDEILTGQHLSSTLKLYLADENENLALFNTLEWNTRIRCSYDPNDKMVKPEDEAGENWLLPDLPLEYTVRFQNTGNDTAYNVVITDQLDENLDWSTFQPLIGSHPYNVKLDKSGHVEFIFEDIFLVDSMTNPIGSQGFITFEIFPKENLPEGQTLYNTAEIFFDANEPIITNTVTNIFTYKLTTSIKPSIEEYKDVFVYPNPFVDGVYIKMDDNILKQNLGIRFFDLAGKQLKHILIKSTNQFIELPDNQLYLYEIFDVTTNKTLKSDKLIKVR